MDWIKQNNFLASFGGIMVLGVLGLGFYAFTSYKGYSSSLDSFAKKQKELKSLENKGLHPDPGNVEKSTERADADQAKVGSLFTKAKGLHPDLPPATGVAGVEQFDAKVNAKLKPFTDKAESLDIIIPSAFELGMEKYAQTPPREEAVQRLEWELDGIAELADVVLESGVDHLENFRRYEQTWEDAPKPAPVVTSKKKKKSKKSKKSAKPVKSGPKLDTVMENTRVRVKLTGTPESITKFLNLVANNDKYFFWTRWAKIGNEDPAGPDSGKTFQKEPIIEVEDPDVDPAAPVKAPEPEPEPEPDPAPEDGAETPEDGADVAPPEVVPFEPEAAAPMRDIFPILGNKRVSVDAVIDIVRFREPVVPDDGKPSSKAKDKNK